MKVCNFYQISWVLPCFNLNKHMPHMFEFSVIIDTGREHNRCIEIHKEVTST